MPSSTRPARSSLVALLVALGVAAVGAAVAGAAPGGTPAAAAVRHAVGLRGTVDGWTSWYGSYDLGPVGRAFCVDHGSSAPDPDHAYVRTDLRLDRATSTALAWLVAVHAGDADRDPVVAAALMLAAHDLRGAAYPSGRLDVDALPPWRLSGFGGREGRILSTARWLKAEAIARSDLRGPFLVWIGPADPVTGARRAHVHDAARRPVQGILLTVRAGPQQAPVRTGADGAAVLAADPSTPLVVEAEVPRLEPEAFAPTRRRAQRVVRAALDRVVARSAPEAPPPPSTTTTTTTTAPPTTTTTTAPPSTTTAVTPSTTAPPPAPPTTTTTTQAAVVEPPTTTSAPPTTTTPSSAPQTTTTSAPAPVTTQATAAARVVASAPQTTAVTALPRTGASGASGPIVAAGAGLVVLGAALLAAGRRAGRSDPLGWTGRSVSAGDHREWESWC